MGGGIGYCGQGLIGNCGEELIGHCGEEGCYRAEVELGWCLHGD